jgi:hypothetical protein
MNLYSGAKELLDIYCGSDIVKNIFLGSNKVYTFKSRLYSIVSNLNGVSKKAWTLTGATGQNYVDGEFFNSVRVRTIITPTFTHSGSIKVRAYIDVKSLNTITSTRVTSENVVITANSGPVEIDLSYKIPDSLVGTKRRLEVDLTVELTSPSDNSVSYPCDTYSELIGCC